jgi:hypothetical protein
MVERRANLETSLNRVSDRLGRLYKANEEGIIDLGEVLKDLVTVLKDEKALIEATLDRLISQTNTQSEISPKSIEASLSSCAISSIQALP